ncbi:hypothetical protein [Sporolactobacillus nakayamae]|uniref:hypothetical protein n=1 Tax=Sporolactobacillus nakayamae TaxID=269670 RepID=UPI000B855689|nr:hypothetical protein [Sporolactobacillus nakayamae]
MNVMVFACGFYGQARRSTYGFQDNRVFDAGKIVEEYLMRPDVEDYPFTRKQIMKAARTLRSAAGNEEQGNE